MQRWRPPPAAILLHTTVAFMTWTGWSKYAGVRFQVIVQWERVVNRCLTFHRPFYCHTPPPCMICWAHRNVQQSRWAVDCTCTFVVFIMALNKRCYAVVHVLGWNNKICLPTIITPVVKRPER